MSPKLKKEMKKILLALLIFFVLVIAEKSGIAAPLMENRLINTILYLIPYLIVGYPVLRKAFLGIKNRRLRDDPHIDDIKTVLECLVRLDIKEIICRLLHTPVIFAT